MNNLAQNASFRAKEDCVILQGQMSPRPSRRSISTTHFPAFLFDLDGTLMDSVYQHVLAWREALEKAGIELSVWRIHRRIGMSGGLFVNALLRETGHQLTKQEATQLQRLHAEAYGRLVAQVRPLPGARQLLDYLSKMKVPWAIATSGRIESAGPALKILGVDPEKVTVITRDQVQYAKPDPDLFLAAAKQLGVDISASVVVGDSVWDLLAARRARALGIGLLSGGYGTEELEKAGAYRVYKDPAEMLQHLDEVGVRTAE
jgi:HAD superfamily hydrolase (TIGR01509 family)